MTNPTPVAWMCCLCHEHKPAEQMRKDKGRYYVCKDCHNTRRRAQYAADPAKVQKQNAGWALRNREHLRTYQRQYRANGGTNRRTQKRKEEIAELADSYVRQIIVGRSNLSHSDIPQSMVEAHRLVLMIKRTANEKRA